MKVLKLLGAALAAVTMTFTAQAEKTAKAVVADGGTTLKFVYDTADYGTKGTDWFSVAEAEAIDPQTDDVPWASYGGRVAKVIFDPSFAGYRPTQCGSWFYGFSSLATIEGIENLDTSEAANFAYMFDYCLTLTALDLSGFDTAKATDMHFMFADSKNLKTISVSDRFVTTKVADSSNMFRGCTALVGGAGTAYDSTKTDKTYARIDKTGQPGYFTSPVAKVILSNDGKTLRFVYDEADYGTKDTDWFSVAEAEATDPHSQNVPWLGKRSTVTKVVFDPSFAAYRPKQCGSWFYNFGGLVAVDGLTNLNTSVATNMAHMFENCSSLTTLDVSGFDTANVTDMRSMFEDCSSLTTLDVSGFDTAKVTDMVYMFYGCSSLTTLDVTGFDTSNVTDMYDMFDGCSSLTTLDVSGFDTANVTDMAYMFYGCSSLTTLDVTGFDTSNVEFMYYMFARCSSLTTLDVTGFDTSKVTDMSYMFYGCSSLEAICVSDRFVTDQVLDSSSMFQSCSKLVGGAGTAYDSTKTDATYARIDGTDGQPGYFTPPPLVAKVLVEDGGTTLRFVYDNKNYGTKDTDWFAVAEAEAIDPRSQIVPWYGKRETVTKVVFDASFKDYHPTQCGRWFYYFEQLSTIENIGNLDTSAATSFVYMFYGCESLTSLDVSGFNTAMVTDMHGMFDGCSSLTTLDVSGFDTSNVTDMYSMFYGCSSLTTLDVSGFDTAKVTGMVYMFCGCSALTTLDVSGFDTANVTDMYSMFYGCSSLTTLDVSGFDTANVTDMAYMFYGCSSLTTLDVSGFDTAKVTNMAYMFGGCWSLTTLDVSGFDTSNVTYMDDLFGGCSSLTTLDVSGFDTSKVTDMSCMFYGCLSLTTLDVSGFDTANVMKMYDMFEGCYLLTSLDVSGFDTSKVTDMSCMFYGCSSLEAICVSDRFVTDQVSDSYSMFKDCSKLVGGAGTAYDSTKTDKTYARIDGEGGQPGYFTAATVLPEGSYCIHFAANGGTGTMADQICTRDKVYNLTKCAFTKTGKAFKGWAGSNGRRYDDGVLVFNAADEDATLTLTAIWE